MRPAGEAAATGPQRHRADQQGERYSTSTASLLRENIIFPGTPIDDTVANLICAQMLFPESENPDQDISIYINSPGGDINAFMAIYDTMQYIRPQISTICSGQAASAAAVLLAAGTPASAHGSAQRAGADDPPALRPVGLCPGVGPGDRRQRDHPSRRPFEGVLAATTAIGGEDVRDTDRITHDAAEAKEYGIIDEGSP